jgi:hypothetical protein
MRESNSGKDVNDIENVANLIWTSENELSLIEVIDELEEQSR